MASRLVMLGGWGQVEMVFLLLGGVVDVVFMWPWMLELTMTFSHILLDAFAI